MAKNPLDILKKVADAEKKAMDERFVAPCVRGGRVRTRIEGLIREFSPVPSNFEGWGIFKPCDVKKAMFLEEAVLEREDYLNHLQKLRMRLSFRLTGSTWLAYPVNEGDARQRFGEARPVPVFLVDDGGPFDQILVAFDGASCWFVENDMRGDPQITDRMIDAYNKAVVPKDLQWSGMTPEERICFELARNPEMNPEAPKTDEMLIKDALKRGGGSMVSYTDRGTEWAICWTDGQGTRHNSTISKSNLTVVSAGFCLSGTDRRYDLQSLVGIAEKRHNSRDYSGY